MDGLVTKQRDKITPHWHWWHPEKSLLDIILSFILSMIIRIPNKFPKPSNSSTTDDLVSQISQSRTTLKGLVETQQMSKSGDSMHQIWAKLIDQDVVEVDLVLPRRDDLLDQWGITPDERKRLKLPRKSTVLLHVTFPISLLPDTIKAPTKALPSGALLLEQDVGEECITKILKENSSLPVLLFAHGGGYTMGTPRAAEAVTELLKHHNAIGEKPRPFLYGSIKYSLAPEHPFPAAPLEATSVASWFLERAGPKSVHLAGVSAGSGLMLSAFGGILKSTMKKRPASVIALCPMLCPACDTLSFYENETSSLVAPAQWLRWSYRCYFQMTIESDGDVDSTTATSNRRAWEQSVWFSSSLREIVEPEQLIRTARGSVDVKIVVSTNSADPLCDSGIAFVNTVDNVTHLRHRGSHCVGTMLNQRDLRELRETLHTTVFGVT